MTRAFHVSPARTAKCFVKAVPTAKDNGHLLDLTAYYYNKECISDGDKPVGAVNLAKVKELAAVFIELGLVSERTEVILYVANIEEVRACRAKQDTVRASAIVEHMHKQWAGLTPNEQIRCQKLHHRTHVDFKLYPRLDDVI